MESISELNNSISIVSHDAGGAELLSSYAMHNKNANFIFALSGPAVKIFRRKLGEISICSINEAVTNSNTIFCGTGWGSTFELNGIFEAKRKKKKSVAFLDHWVSYKERFLLDGKAVLPDEIWVSDNHAEKFAYDIFPDIKIRLIKNYFFEDIKKAYKKIEIYKANQIDGLNVLFVSDNIDAVIEKDPHKKLYLNFSDKDIFRHLLKNLDSLNAKIKKISIRPHPSEFKAAEKYQQLINNCIIPCSISGESTLLEEIANNDIIVGGDSMALVVSMICGKKTYSSIPPGGNFSLPYDEIKRL